MSIYLEPNTWTNVHAGCSYRGDDIEVFAYRKNVEKICSKDYFQDFAQKSDFVLKIQSDATIK